MTNTPCIPVDYQSDHLFLLIGTNPLPNLVAAKLLMKPGGQLHLVHSSATQPVAERLARYWIDKEKGLVPRYVYVQEANGADIQRNIESELWAIPVGNQIGLHYTGGTKIMSVHSCLTLLDHQNKQRTAVTLSYLDARTSKMHLEHGSNQPFVSDPTLQCVKPAIKAIVDLHAFRLVSDIVAAALLPELATALADAHQSEDAGRAWRKWCNEVLRQQTRTKKESEWDKETKLKQVVLTLPDDASLRTVVDKMREMFALDENSLPLDPASRKARFNKVKHLCEWLDGKWLEHFTYQAIQKIEKEQTEQSDKRLHDIGMGIHPQSEPDGPQYDVDIAVMQGYRLYAISCTTDDDPGMCKLKLFEAYQRARNMAGDDAHVALVCLTANPKNLEKQLNRSWDAEGKVRVFGQAHLHDLSTHLAEWFDSTGTR